MALFTADQPLERPVAPEAPGDDVLLEKAWAGDREGVAALRERYRATALAVARVRAGDGAAAEDVASAALDRIEQVVGEGHGPRAFLGAFVVWMTGREADSSPGSIALPDEHTDPGSLVRIFTHLPAQWQTLLWHTEIRGRSVRRAAAVLGISSAAAVLLQRDARNGLRRAYRRAGAGLEAGADCAPCRQDLPGVVRGGLPPQRRREVLQHLAGCTACTAEYLCRQGPGAGLRTWLLPVLAGLPLWSPEAAALAQLMRAADAAPGEEGEAPPGPLPGRRTKVLLGAGVLATVTAVAVAGLSSAGDPARDPAPVPVAEAAPAAAAPGTGAAGARSGTAAGAAPSAEEPVGAPGAAPVRDQDAPALSSGDGPGPRGEPDGAAPGAQQPVAGGSGALLAPVPVTLLAPVPGAVPEVLGGRDPSTGAPPGRAGSGAVPAEAVGARAEVPGAAPRDAGPVAAGRPATGTSPSRESAAPSPAPSVRSSLPPVLLDPVPSPVPAVPPRPSLLPSAPTGAVQDVDRQRTDRSADGPESWWGERAGAHRGWSRNEDHPRRRDVERGHQGSPDRGGGVR